VRLETEPGVFRDAPDPFADLPRGHFKAIYADPPWQFQAWAGARLSGDRRPCAATKPHYQTMADDEIAALRLHLQDLRLFVDEGRCAPS
jgi:hypothetical protein